MLATLLAATDETTGNSTLDTILWIVALLVGLYGLYLIIMGLLSLADDAAGTRRRVYGPGLAGFRLIVVGVICIIIAALIGPGGHSIFT